MEEKEGEEILIIKPHILILCKTYWFLHLSNITIFKFPATGASIVKVAVGAT